MDSTSIADRNDAHGSRPEVPAPRVLASAPEGRAAKSKQIKASVEALNFYYGTNHALKNLNITVIERQVTALIGPSGCGKSTFLRCFNRMHDLQPNTRYEGTITLHPDNLNLIGR